MKNNTKKLACLLLALMLVLSFAACGGSDEDNSKLEPTIPLGDHNPEPTGVEQFVKENGAELEEVFNNGFVNGYERNDEDNPPKVCTITAEDTVLVITCRLYEEIHPDPQKELESYINEHNFNKDLSSLKNIPDLTAVKIVVNNKNGENIATREIEHDNLADPEG